MTCASSFASRFKTLVILICGHIQLPNRIPRETSRPKRIYVIDIFGEQRFFQGCYWVYLVAFPPKMLLVAFVILSRNRLYILCFPVKIPKLYGLLMPMSSWSCTLLLDCGLEGRLFLKYGRRGAGVLKYILDCGSFDVGWWWRMNFWHLKLLSLTPLKSARRRDTLHSPCMTIQLFHLVLTQLVAARRWMD